MGPVVEGTTVPNGTKVPGTPFQVDPIRGAFNIGTQIRWLDFNVRRRSLTETFADCLGRTAGWLPNGVILPTTWEPFWLLPTTSRARDRT
jgi:hypothetical protein